jgi:hypothetical protein
MAPALPMQGGGTANLRLLRALGIRRWDWRTCWRTADFWLAVATLLLPFGFLLLLLQWEPIRTRVRFPR